MPASFRGRCTPVVVKLGRKPRAFLVALLRMPSMVVSCLSLNTSRRVAWDLDFSNSSIAIDFRGGLSLRFARASAYFLTSLVTIWRKCSRKSSMGLICIPSILYDLFGGRYLMWNQSANVMELICSCSTI